MLSAAAMPRCIDALMPERPFSRSSSVSSATQYDRNIAKSSRPASFCVSATQMMKPTAHAARNTVSGEPAAVADDSLDSVRRSRLAASVARFCS